MDDDAGFLPNVSRPQREPYEHPRLLRYACDSCGKLYAAPHHLAGHQRSCDSNKRTIEYMLADSKRFWEMRKKRRLEKQVAQAAYVEEVEAEQPVAEQALPAMVVSETIQQASPEHLLVEENMLYDCLCAQSNINLTPTSADSVGDPASSSLALQDTERPNMDNPSADLNVPVAQRKAKRVSRLPKRFVHDDAPPATPRPALQPPTIEADQQESATVSAEPTTDQGPRKKRAAPTKTVNRRTLLRLVFQSSKRDTFGVMKTYRLPVGSTIPHDPDQITAIRRSAGGPPGDLQPSVGAGPTYGPFKSKTAFSLADWYWNSSSKSFQDFQKLISILKDPSFSVDDAVSVNWKAAFNALGANQGDSGHSDDDDWITDDGWRSTPIDIEVPFHNKMKLKANKGVESYRLGEFRHRRIISVIKEKISNIEDSRGFHYAPFKATWKPQGQSKEVELYGELYASQAFRAAHEEVHKLPSTDANQGLERVVVALMLWSDGTHLSAFSNATLWPCYMFFGNESKYRRCRPSEGLANHIAYFRKLPDTFFDYLKDRNGGKIPSDALIAYCTREAFHRQWSILLDEELLDAMRRGITIVCPDKITRCFYPRIFTYSADYPEKVLVAGTRNNGLCPCHRCLVLKNDLAKLGAPSDMERHSPRVEPEITRLVGLAQQEILENGFAVDSDAKVEPHLKPTSLVPSKNAFSNFPGHPFDIRRALVVDQMHEFESGVWKKVFVHALRLLEHFSTASTTLTAELDSRYRDIPAFGRDSIRKFGLNVSDMKRRAARDFADLLQCALAAFEALLPEPHNTIVMELLYICAQWHALAKLRLHNDYTVDYLDYTTKMLGAQMRRFSQETCSGIDAKELPKEAEARARREGKGKGAATQKLAKFGIFTIKFHFLGDYVSTIRWFGTCDSYTTETGELAHRLPKSWYPRTDKKEFEVQMSQIERRQSRLDQIRSNNQVSDPQHSSKRDSRGPLAPSPDRRYVVAKSQDDPVDVSLLGHVPGFEYGDIYTKDFLPKLKQYLLPRILEKLGYPPDSVPQSEYYNVILTNDRVYRHKILRVNYTTYDVQRSEDVIHINTPQCNVMLLNKDYSKATWSTSHPYLYGRCLGVYHANVSFLGCLPDRRRLNSEHRIDFVWVHWYDYISAGQPLALDRLSLIRPENPNGLGFIDPADILRGVHVIPQFSLGEAEGEQARSKWVPSPAKHWKAFYINRFADRDLFMRYQYGMSVGHTYMAGRFPPPVVPRLPADFDFYVGGEDDGEDEDENVDDDEAQESPHYSHQHEMDDRELRFYSEMYDT